jgi:pimeloyl-ACP methyl ester carboxylesterase
MWSTSAGSGVPLVLIPGGFSDYRYWELQQIAYAPHYRAIAVSLSGYYPDQSTVQDPLSAERHIEETGEFLRSLGEPVNLLGHSRGGRIAPMLRHALRIR